MKKNNEIQMYYDDCQKIEFDFDVEQLYKSLADITFKTTKAKKRLPISVTLVNKWEIKKINYVYREKKSATDVISFSFLDNDQANYMLGEMYICPAIAKKQAKAYNHSLKREMGFLFVHGLLHILGYNHIEKNEEKIMFDLQDKILEKGKVTR